MTKSLRVLILEDNRSDAELAVFELEEAGFSVTATVVEKEIDYIRELKASCFDLILSDYDLPQYNGAQALQEATRRCPDTPFILVSGVVTEDRAIEILTQGAKDYVLKNRLQQRLIPAVRRALTEANEQGARKKAEEELREAHKNLERQVNERTLQLQKELEHRRQIEATLLRYNERLEILSYTAARLLASDRPQQIVEELCLKVMAFLDCQAFFNFLVEESAGRLHLNACAGIPPETAREIEWLNFGTAVCGCAARDGLRIIAENIPQTPDERTELIKSFGIKAYACHPLMEQNHVLGTLSFGTRTRTAFSEDDLAMMKAVADQVAMAMSRVRTENALRKITERFDMAQHVAEVGTWDWDIVNGNIEWSTQMFDLFRLDPRKNKSSFDLWNTVLHPDDVKIAGRRIDEALKNKTILNSDYRIILPDGRIRWINSVGEGRYNDQNQAVRMIGICMDITDRKQKEEALRGSEERYRELVDSSPEAVIVHHDGQFLYANPAALVLYGAQSLDQLQAKTVLDLIPDDERARVASRMAKGKSGEKLNLQETKLTRLDGRVTPVESVGGAVTYNGKPAVQIMIRDITGRKLAEEAVSRSRQTFSELVERAPFGIYTVDSRFRIAQMNMGSQDGAFRNVRPLIGRDFAEAMHILWPEPVAENIIAAFRHTLDTGEPYYSPRFVNPRHDVPEVEAYEWELHRMTLPDGQHGVICYYFDSTKLREAEAALAQNEARFRAVLDNSRDVIYCLNVQTGRFEYISPSAETVVGYSPRELTEQSSEAALAMIHPDDLPVMEAAIKQLGETGRADVEYRQRDKRGGYHWLSNHMSLERDAAGRPLYRYGNIRDITPKRRTDEALYKSEERFRRYFELGLIGMVVTTLDKGIEEANEKFCEMTGYEKDELLQMTWAQLTHPDDLAKDISHFNRVMDGELDGYSIEKRFIRKDGGVIDAILAVRCVRTAQGSIDSFLALVQDITGRKSVETQREAALAALRESEEKYRNLVQYAPAAIYEMDLAGTKFFSVNDVMCDILGYSREDLMSMKPAELLSGESASLFEERKKQKLGGGVIDENTEYRIRKKDGSWMHVAVYVGVVTSPDEQSPRVAVIAHDITARKKVEEALRESEQRLKLHLENSPLAVVEWDTDFTVTQWSGEAERIFGWEKEEAIGKRIDQLHMIYDQDIPVVNRTIERLTSGDERAVISTNRNYTKSGTVIECRWHNSIILDANGQMESVMSLVEDITERTRTERAIVLAKEEWERTFDTLPDLIAILDNHHRIVRVNKAMADRLGATPEHCTGLHCSQVVHGMDQPPAFCPHSLTCRDGRQHVAEVHEPNLGGDFLVSTTPLCDSSGQLIGSVHVARDITARKAAEDQLAEQATELQERTAQLEEANRELESFSYSVSHDLRAPLRAIDGISRIIIRQLGDQLDENARRQFDMLRDNARLMSVLIDNLLAFSRVQKTGLIAAVIDMEKLVREVWEEIRKAHAERELEFRINGLLPGFGDQALIRQVLTNLLGNAVKFTKNRRPGIVSVTSAQDAGKIIYTVRDNGAGFNMEYADKLFGVFQRLHSQEEFEGTGVGLAIVQRIILRHGGRVWGEGREDEGASFSFSLPPIDTQHDGGG